jgi:hypothetical protein
VPSDHDAATKLRTVLNGVQAQLVTTRAFVEVLAQSGTSKRDIIGVTAHLDQLEAALRELTAHPLLNGSALPAAGPRPAGSQPRTLFAVYRAQRPR